MTLNILVHGCTDQAETKFEGTSMVGLSQAAESVEVKSQRRNSEATIFLATVESVL